MTHVDYSARVRTVHRETNPRYHELLASFTRRTGCPVLVNTSFNVRGEPIVCTPEDAFRCFIGTEIEALAAGTATSSKEEQDRDAPRPPQVAAVAKFDSLGLRLYDGGITEKGGGPADMSSGSSKPREVVDC